MRDNDQTDILNTLWWVLIWALFALGVCLCFVGCQGPGGVSADPRTWFSGSELRGVERAQGEVLMHRDEAIRTARAEVAKAAQSIDAAPQDNLPVQLTGRFIDNALPLLDQVAGPMTAVEAAELRQLVSDLLAGKTEAEARQRRLESQLQTLSADLDAALKALDRKQQELQEGFRRENAAANRARTAQAYAWAGAGTSMLLMVGLWYFKSFGGGAIKGVASALADLQAKRHPAYGDFVTALDVNLSPALQDMVARRRKALEA